MNTIEYYNRNAQSYANDTISADVSNLYSLFEKYVPDNASILDLGCGSGRDSKYFISRGYKVTAVDGSAELCRSASEYIGMDVRCLLFSDLDYFNEFDGVWACASLLHVPECELPYVFGKVQCAMKTGGCFYCSFKYGEFSGERNGRFFTDLNEKGLERILASTDGLQIAETIITSDVRKNRENENWLNAILIKTRDIGFENASI